MRRYTVKLLGTLPNWWASASCTRGLSEPVAARVRGQQLRTLFKQNGLMTATTLVVVAIIAVEFAEVAPFRFGVWLFSILCSIAGAYTIASKLRGETGLYDASPRVMGHIERVAGWQAFIWGSPPLLFYPVATTAQQPLLAMITTGTFFCGALLFAAIPRASIIYATLALAATSLALALTPGMLTLSAFLVLVVQLTIVCGTVVTLGKQAAQHVIDQQLIADAANAQKRLRADMHDRETRARAVAAGASELGSRQDLAETREMDVDVARAGIAPRNDNGGIA